MELLKEDGDGLLAEDVMADQKLTDLSELTTPIRGDVLYIGDDPGNIWVSDMTASGFTVNCRNDPGASDLDFGWQAIVL